MFRRALLVGATRVKKNIYLRNHIRSSSDHVTNNDHTTLVSDTDVLNEFPSSLTGIACDYRIFKKWRISKRDEYNPQQTRRGKNNVTHPLTTALIKTNNSMGYINVSIYTFIDNLLIWFMGKNAIQRCVCVRSFLCARAEHAPSRAI